MKARMHNLTLIALALLPAQAVFAYSPEEAASLATEVQEGISGQLPEAPKAAEARPAAEAGTAAEAKPAAEPEPAIVAEAPEAEISGQVREPASATATASADAKPEVTRGGHAVVAMDAKRGTGVRANELFTVGADPVLLINRHNQRYELSPRSVVELDDQGALRVLRGSGVAESREESGVYTAGAKIDFVGKVLVSYDHAEKSTSAFVLSGEARLENAHRSDSTLRLQRFRGATLVVGDVLPQLIRQLDVGSVQTWLKGYGWPPARRDELLKEMPGKAVVAEKEVPKHLEDTKIEDYFSSIDTADEFHQPDYYDRKFDDPDKVVAEQNSKSGAAKSLTPEEAALISLPKVQIDLGFELGPEFLTADQKSKEVEKLGTAPARVPASVAHARNSKVAKAARKTAKKQSETGGDPDVQFVLERLRQVRSANPAVSQAPARSRTPASEPSSAVPDPVYDYSQNF